MAGTKPGHDGARGAANVHQYNLVMRHTFARRLAVDDLGCRALLD
jgi:hypothetical protein